MYESAPRRPVAIVLAGGRGQRYAAAGGEPFKQCVAMPDGRSLLEHVCALYAGCGLRVLCALHPALASMTDRLRSIDCETLIVDDADRGMGYTLSRAVAATPSPAGWVVALGDMPAIQPATVHAIVAALQGGAPLSAPRHDGRRGHPVGFAERFGARLRALDGDQGAHAILRDHVDQLHYIDVDDAGVLLDIDRPAQLGQYMRP